ncbi:MAG: GMC family oxidoreductase, partial [Spirochaetes bacterium]|nr:GMC family oxidoreductase [Spirochaetota bacterium]
MAEKIYDYIVIGSGFGGSVSAMRLAEKGYSVLILEKGREFRNKDFPETNLNFSKYFWAPALKWFGFQKLTFFREVFILSGVGVGGGSLGYANTHMFPPDEFFNNPVWSHFKDWKETLKPFYEKARFMLGTTKNITFDRADEILKEVAKDMGRETSFGGVDVGIYFGDTEKETDPYFKGLGPKRKGCDESAGCMVGCRQNAKNTLDKNYLFFAKKFGADIEAERMVERVEYEDNLYHLHTHCSTSRWKRGKRKYSARGLVVAGGVLGTMDLLLKQKYRYKTLTGLSDKLGENLRTNSETLCGVTSSGVKLNHGIAISSVFNPDDNTHIEIVKYPDGSNTMKLFATLATGSGPPVIRSIKLFLRILLNPFKFLKFIFDKNWANKSVIFLVMQSLDNSMKMIYKRFPFKGISIRNKRENRVPAYIDIGQQVMYKYAEKVNGIPQNALTEVLFNMSTTAHILGGCPMGRSIDEGVVNEKFKAYGYPNMYILDGSIIPCNLGVNPALTITVLSEYAMSL